MNEGQEQHGKQTDASTQPEGRSCRSAFADWLLTGAHESIDCGFFIRAVGGSWLRIAFLDDGREFSPGMTHCRSLREKDFLLFARGR